MTLSDVEDLLWLVSGIRRRLERSIRHDTKDAASIVDTLITGHDPESGEELPPETVLHRASVIRALLVAKEAIAQ